MTAVLLDTHTWVWSMLDMPDLHPAARGAIEEAQTVYVPPCSFHEITQKHRSGKVSVRFPRSDVEMECLLDVHHP